MRRWFTVPLLVLSVLFFFFVPAMAQEMVQIQFDWTDNNADEDGYRYELKDNSDPANPWVLRLDNIAPGVLFAQDMVEVGKEWCGRITVFRNVDSSEVVSLPACVTTVSELQPLQSADPVTATQPGAPAP